MTSYLVLQGHVSQSPLLETLRKFQWKPVYHSRSTLQGQSLWRSSGPNKTAIKVATGHHIRRKGPTNNSAQSFYKDVNEHKTISKGKPWPSQNNMENTGFFPEIVGILTIYMCARARFAKWPSKEWEPYFSGKVSKFLSEVVFIDQKNFRVTSECAKTGSL